MRLAVTVSLAVLAAVAVIAAWVDLFSSQEGSRPFKAEAAKERADF